MADRPDTDAEIVRRVLGYVITEDGSSQAAREVLDRLTARLSEAEQELRILRALAASDDPTAALMRERLAAHNARDRLAARLSEAEDERDELERLAYESNEREKDKEARLSEYEQALRAADDLLRRLSEWDVMNLAPLGGHSDVPFWQAEIARVRAALSGSAESGGGTDG